jgi:ferrous iron transport protein A
MHQTLADPPTEAPADSGLVRLGHAKPGGRGVIVEVRVEHHEGGRGVEAHELERRLLEFGFVEGARVEVLHEGLVGHDPIAVRLDDMRVALRRRDAEDIWVRLDAQ